MADAPRRRSRGTAREAILCAIIEIIGQDGIDAITHRRVAELAGVSPGSTTHHFTSRDDLLCAAFRHYLQQGDRMITAIDAHVRATVANPIDRVQELLCQIFQQEFTDERTVRAEYEMMLYASTHAELATELRAWEARWLAHLASDLEAAGTARAIETARTLLNLHRGFELERLLNRELDVDELRRRLTTVLAATTPTATRAS